MLALLVVSSLTIYLLCPQDLQPHGRALPALFLGWHSSELSLPVQEPLRWGGRVSVDAAHSECMRTVCTYKGELDLRSLS